ncbi:MAG TPA: chromosome partitioning protein ParA [Prolixibacteraceae bacterium]|nr:chromosome partitioning protein ParA [Prolixibacteraceae bacterium]
MTEVSKTTTVARINQVDILVIENGEKRVAVKPICEAIGVDFSSQLQKIKEDEILGSTVGLSTTVGADKKEREMASIPFKFVFGWIFGISAKNVKEEAREVLIKYKLECYEALYKHFTSYAEFVEQKQKQIDRQLEIEREARRSFYTAKTVLKEAESELYKISKLTFSDYNDQRRQLAMFSDHEMNG